MRWYQWLGVAVLSAAVVVVVTVTLVALTLGIAEVIL